jgi:hypothetical protein
VKRTSDGGNGNSFGVEISGFHGEESSRGLLGCDTVQSQKTSN